MIHKLRYVHLCKIASSGVDSPRVPGTKKALNKFLRASIERVTYQHLITTENVCVVYYDKLHNTYDCYNNRKEAMVIHLAEGDETLDGPAEIETIILTGSGSIRWRRLHLEDDYFE
jgi:hypothetical protein